MAPRLMLLLVLALGAAGCGAEEAVEPGGAAGTDLVVRVDDDGPRGPEAAKELRVRCAPGDESGACAAAAELTPEELEAAADNVACTDIYGGAQTARVSGTLRGEAVSGEFSRRDGCEISRWDAVAPLLDRVR